MSSHAIVLGRASWPAVGHLVHLSFVSGCPIFTHHEPARPFVMMRVLVRLPFLARSAIGSCLANAWSSLTLRLHMVLVRLPSLPAQRLEVAKRMHGPPSHCVCTCQGCANVSAFDANVACHFDYIPLRRLTEHAKPRFCETSLNRFTGSLVLGLSKNCTGWAPYASCIRPPI